MKKGNCPVTTCVAKTLLVIGGINWGLVGAAGFMEGDKNWNVVNMILGSWPNVEMGVYVLVGLSALYVGYHYTKCCK